MDSISTIDPDVWAWAGPVCVLICLMSYRIIKKSSLTIWEFMFSVALGSYAGKGVGYFLAHYPQSYDEFRTLFDTVFMVLTPLYVVLVITFAVVTLAQDFLEKSKQPKSNVG